MSRVRAERAILDVRSAAAMASAHLDAVREKATGAFWCSGLREQITRDLLDDAERELTEAEQEMEKARAALATVRAEMSNVVEFKPSGDAA